MRKTKILAALPDPVDLFADQAITIDEDKGNIKADTLVGPDFIVETGEAPFDPLAATVTLPVQLRLPKVEVLGIRPVMALDLLLRKHPKGYLLETPGALAVKLPAISVLERMNIAAGDATLAIGVDPWLLRWQGSEGKPVARVVMPGLDGIAFEVSRLAIGAAGVIECVAALTPGRVAIGGLQLQVGEGTLVMRGSQVEARLQARFELDYFRGASVELQLAVSGDLAANRWRIDGMTRIANNVPWQDPTGMLSFDQMAVTVEFAENGGAFTSKAHIGGRVRFLPRALAENADAWFGGLFSGLTVSFDKAELPLGAFDAASFGFGFSPPEGLRLRALGIFDMRVPTLFFRNGSVSLLDASLRIDAGGAVLAGSIGEIRIRLQDGPAVDLAFGPSIALELAAPGGFKGQAWLAQVKGDNVQAVEGGGRISSPAMGAVEATFHIGRFRSGPGEPWQPALSVVAAQDDVNIALFPGVVITRVELGAGINRRVAGVTGLSLAAANQKLRDGLPDVMRQDQWENSPGELCVLARIWTESAQTFGDKALSLYVADLTLLMTSDFQLAAFGKLWFYTSRADAKSADFQKMPAAVGLALFDGQQPSLRMVAMTRRDGRSSLDKLTPIPAGQLLAMQMPRAQMAFEATPSGMALALGPVDVGTTLGPLQVAGSTMFVLRSAGGRVYALSRSSLSAAFYAATDPVGIGPASFSGSVSAGFAASLALLGDFDGGRLTIYGLAHASCYVELTLHVRIGFQIRIKLLFGSMTISWYEHWDFGMSMHVDLDLEAALSSDGGIGIDGRARVLVRVLGMSAGLTLRIAAGDEVVERGRGVYRNINADIDKLLGAPA